MKQLSLYLLILFVLVLLTGSKINAADDQQTIDSDDQLLWIDSISATMKTGYIFEDVADKMEKFVREQYQKGIYKELTDPNEFARKLTEDLQSVSKDRHLGVRCPPPPVLNDICNNEPTDADLERFREERAYNNYAFRTVERLTGNIGYLKFDGFSNTEDAGATAIAAMNFLGHVDALIIDLRENGGGSPSMIQLISSYFFDEKKHLNSFYIRDGDINEQFWTQEYVVGPRMSNIDLYVLTSDYTFSAAEEFTYNLKNMKRATIIGETTGGGAHPVETHCYEGLPFVFRLPYGRAINPISGTNWEGTGVEPDIKVDADDAFEVAKLEAMKNLIPKLKDENRKQRLEFAYKIARALHEPFKLSEKLMKSYAGAYGPRNIIFENGQLYYQRVDRPKYKMISLSETMFCFEDLDFFMLEVVTDEKGAPLKLIGHYDNGQTDESLRTTDK